MLRRALLCALALCLVTPALAFASPWHHDGDQDRLRTSGPHRTHDRAWGDRGFDSRNYGDRRDAVWNDRDDWDDEDDASVEDDGDSSDDSSDDTTGTSVEADTGAVAVAGGPGKILTGPQRTITVRTTGFSYFDNSPPSSATVCCGTWHKEAGGTGLREDPITVAVPGSGGTGMEFPAGTLFYSSTLKRYLGVEDSGASKFDQPHLDIWVGGQGFSRSSSDRCMEEITGTQQVIVNPPPGIPVNRGPLTGSNGCAL